MKISLISFRPLLFFFHFLFRFVFVDFVLLSLVSFYFVFISLISFRFVSFRFVFVDFVSFRFVFVNFVSFRFVSFSLISFRFVSFRFVSFLFRFALYRYPSIDTTKNKCSQQSIQLQFIMCSKGGNSNIFKYKLYMPIRSENILT